MKKKWLVFLLLLLIICFIRKETIDMSSIAVIYVSLIVKGKKSYKDVPDKLKPEVKQLLIDLDLEYLIEE